MSHTTDHRLQDKPFSLCLHDAQTTPGKYLKRTVADTKCHWKVFLCIYSRNFKNSVPFPTNIKMKRLCCPTELHFYTNTQILSEKTWTMISKNSYSNCSFSSLPLPPPNTALFLCSIHVALKTSFCAAV